MQEVWEISSLFRIFHPPAPPLPHLPLTPREAAPYTARMTLTVSEPAAALQHDLPFERATLSNGLRVVLHPDRSLPLVAVNLWYHVGSKNERPGRTGFAHLFEHMLFQGSQNVATNDHFRH